MTRCTVYITANNHATFTIQMYVNYSTDLLLLLGHLFISYINHWLIYVSLLNHVWKINLYKSIKIKRHFCHIFTSTLRMWSLTKNSLSSCRCFMDSLSLFFHYSFPSSSVTRKVCPSVRLSLQTKWCHTDNCNKIYFQNVPLKTFLVFEKIIQPNIYLSFFVNCYAAMDSLSLLFTL